MTIRVTDPEEKPYGALHPSSRRHHFSVGGKRYLSVDAAAADEATGGHAAQGWRRSGCAGATSRGA